MVIATYRPAEDHSPPETPAPRRRAGAATAGLCRGAGARTSSRSRRWRSTWRRGFRTPRCPAALPRRLHQRTDGHPLFLVHVVDDLVAQGVLAEQGGTWHLAGTAWRRGRNAGGRSESPAWLAVLETQVPQTVRAMIEVHLERLDRPAQQALEAAAVAGMEFSAAAVAAARRRGRRRRPSRLATTWRRGTDSSSRAASPSGPTGRPPPHYRFVHELYHNVVYEQMPVARRVRLHQSLGLRLEAAWGKPGPEEAAELAMHFEHGRDWPRAVALPPPRRPRRRPAVRPPRGGPLPRAAALAALDRLPERRAAAEHELDVLMRLGVNLQVTRGFAAPEVEAVHARAVRPVPRVRRRRPPRPRRLPGALGHLGLPQGPLRPRAGPTRCATNCCEMAQRQRRHRAAAPGAPGDVRHRTCASACPTSRREHMEQAAAVYDPAAHARQHERLRPGSRRRDPGVRRGRAVAPGPAARGPGGERAVAATARRIDQPSSLGRRAALCRDAAPVARRRRGGAGTGARRRPGGRGRLLVLARRRPRSFAAGPASRRQRPRPARASGGGGGESSRHGRHPPGPGRLARHRQPDLSHLLPGPARRRPAAPRPARRGARPLDEALSAAQLLPEGLYEAELHRLRGCSVIGLSGDPRTPTHTTASSRPFRSPAGRVRSGSSCARQRTWRHCSAAAVNQPRRTSCSLPPRVSSTSRRIARSRPPNFAKSQRNRPSRLTAISPVSYRRVMTPPAGAHIVSREVVHREPGMTTQAITDARTSQSAEVFERKMLDALDSAALMLVTSVGHRTGLFETMAATGAASATCIAREAGLSERYVREWLAATVAGGVVEHDTATGNYWLPAERAACLTRTSGQWNAGWQHNGSPSLARSRTIWSKHLDTGGHTPVRLPPLPRGDGQGQRRAAHAAAGLAGPAARARAGGQAARGDLRPRRRLRHRRGGRGDGVCIPAQPVHRLRRRTGRHPYGPRRGLAAGAAKRPVRRPRRLRPLRPRRV